jgi:hypothetical protein
MRDNCLGNNVASDIEKAKIVYKFFLQLENCAKLCLYPEPEPQQIIRVPQHWTMKNVTSELLSIAILGYMHYQLWHNLMIPSSPPY